MSEMIVNTNLTASFTGHIAYELQDKHVVRVDHRGRPVSRVLRSKLPADFGPDMKAGAFGMADAYNDALAKSRRWRKQS